MQTLRNLLAYIFNSDPGQAFSYYIPMLVLVVLLIAGSIYTSRLYEKKKRSDFAYKRLFKNLSKTMATFGVLFLILLGLRYESIPYFSMRLWLYITFGVFLYVAYRYVEKFRKQYPIEKANQDSNSNKRKKQTTKIYTAQKKRR